GPTWDEGLFEVGRGEFAAGLRVLDDSAWDKALGSLLIAQADLDPFVAAKVVGDPSLAAFVLASDPVAEQHTFVGIPLLLDLLVVKKLSSGVAGALRSRLRDGVGGGG